MSVPLSYQFHGAPLAKPLDADALARLFPMSARAAQAWLRELPNIVVGRRRFTTEAWLVTWMAANVRNAPVPKNYDPLEAAVVERAIWLVGQLVQQGKLALPKSLTGGNRGNADSLLSPFAPVPVPQPETAA
jgi:hypothetical protein